MVILQLILSQSWWVTAWVGDLGGAPACSSSTAEKSYSHPLILPSANRMWLGAEPSSVCLSVVIYPTLKTGRSLLQVTSHNLKAPWDLVLGWSMGGNLERSFAQCLVSQPSQYGEFLTSLAYISVAGKSAPCWGFNSCMMFACQHWSVIFYTNSTTRCFYVN